MTLLHIERGGLFHKQPNGGWLPCDLHIWLGPIGVHIFRDPFEVELDWLGRDAWREEKAGEEAA